MQSSGSTTKMSGTTKQELAPRQLVKEHPGESEQVTIARPAF